MVWEIINNVVVPILQWISYIVAVLTLVTIFAPSSISTPIRREIKKLMIRNVEFPFTVEKAFVVKKTNLDTNELRKRLKSNIKIAFSKFNIQIIDKEHNHNLSAVLVRSGFHITINILIIPKGDHDGENYEIMVQQKTKTNFGSIEKCLIATLWNLTKFQDENHDLIKQASNNVEITIDAEGLKVFTEIFEATGTNIIGDSISMYQDKGQTVISIRDEFELEFAKKIKDLIELGYI